MTAIRSHRMGRLVGLGCEAFRRVLDHRGGRGTNRQFRFLVGPHSDPIWHGSRTRARTKDGDSDTSTDVPPSATHGHWAPWRGEPSPSPPRPLPRKMSPTHRSHRGAPTKRAGSKTDPPKDDAASDGPSLDTPASVHADTPRRPFPRRTTTRGDIVHSSYSPAENQDRYSTRRRRLSLVVRMAGSIICRSNSRIQTAGCPPRLLNAPIRRMDIDLAARDWRWPIKASSYIRPTPSRWNRPCTRAKSCRRAAHLGNGHMEMGPPNGEWIEGEGPPGNCGGDDCGGCGSCCCRPLCALLCGPWWDEWCQDLSIYAASKVLSVPSIRVQMQTLASTKGSTGDRHCGPRSGLCPRSASRPTRAISPVSFRPTRPTPAASISSPRVCSTRRKVPVVGKEAWFGIISMTTRSTILRSASSVAT